MTKAERERSANQGRAVSTRSRSLARCISKTKTIDPGDAIAMWSTWPANKETQDEPLEPFCLIYSDVK